MPPKHTFLLHSSQISQQTSFQREHPLLETLIIFQEAINEATLLGNTQDRPIYFKNISQISTAYGQWMNIWSILSVSCKQRGQAFGMIKPLCWSKSIVGRQLNKSPNNESSFGWNGKLPSKPHPYPKINISPPYFWLSNKGSDIPPLEVSMNINSPPKILF